MNSNEDKFTRLREMAEQLLLETNTNIQSRTDEFESLLHELRVYQIELKVQNEELIRTQESLEVTQARLARLYDYAPLVYLVVDSKSRIIDANLTAIAKLNTTRKELYTQPLAHFIAIEERDIYHKYHRSLRVDRSNPSLEVWFKEIGFEPFYARIECSVLREEDGKVRFLLAITDITDRRLRELEADAIMRINQAILTQQKEDEVVKLAISELWRLLSTEYISLVLFKPQLHRITMCERIGSNYHTRVIGYSSSISEIYMQTGEVDIDIVKRLDFISSKVNTQYSKYTIAKIPGANNVAGLIVVGLTATSTLDARQTKVLNQFAEQMGVAIQQFDYSHTLHTYTRTLEHRVLERTEKLRKSKKVEQAQRVFAEEMLSVVKVINNSFDIQYVLDTILNSLINIVDYDGARILVLSQITKNIVVTKAKFDKIDETFNASKIDTYYPYEQIRQKQTHVMIDDHAYRQLNSANTTDRVMSYLCVPILSKEDITGFIELFGMTPYMFEEEDLHKLKVFVEHIAIAISNTQLYVQAQELATLQERHRIARDLHDAVSQHVFAVKIMTESIAKLIQVEKYREASNLSLEVQMLAGIMRAEFSLILMELGPEIPKQVDLGDLLFDLVNALSVGHPHLKISLNFAEIPNIPTNYKTQLYRIAQEALHNAVKHAQSEVISVNVQLVDNSIQLSVEDDGIGFQIDKIISGHGLRNMRERADSIGANLLIDSTKGGGTQITINTPV